MNTWIVIRVSAPGLHLWPDAPQLRDYLANEHRHVFHVELRIEAAADNARTLEFHDVRDETLEQLRLVGAEIPGDLIHFGDSSCEMIAVKLMARVRSALGLAPSRRMTCSVFEDNENGAIVEGP